MLLRLLTPVVVALLLPLAVLLSPAPAPAAPGQVADPATTFAVGTDAFGRAIDVAQRSWGVIPCDGDVSYSWAPLPPMTNAQATWSSVGAPYGNPTGNRNCRIVFGNAAPFDWAMLCTVAAHETGHLLGYRHDPGEGRLMSELYSGTLPDCAAAAPAVTATGSTARKPRTSQRRRRARTRCEIVRRHGRKVRRCTLTHRWAANRSAQRRPV